MESNNSSNQSNGAGFLLIVTLFFLGISVWQTSLGYELILGTYLAWFFAIAIGLMMLFLALEMRKRRVRGESAVGPLIGYCACAIFCFFGNFNAIYTRYNREELYKKELQQHKDELTAIVTSATVALQKADTTSFKLKKNVEEHEGQLIRQILDPANSGLGKRAMEEVIALEQLLNQKLTRFSGSPAVMANSYKDNITQILSTRLAESKMIQSKNLISKIQAGKDTISPLIYDALKPQNVVAKGQAVIFKTVDEINNIGEETQNFVGKNYFSYQPAQFENQEMGKISHTFQSAFNGTNTSAAFISVILALGIDALVPFVIFVGTRRDEEQYDSYRTKNGKGGVEVIR